MSTLTELLTDPARRPAAIAALTTVAEEEVASKSGISGMALKTAYNAATKVRPGLVEGAITRLLPQITAALDPFWASKGETPFGQHLVANGDQASDALLAVGDQSIETEESSALKKIYSSMRPKGKELVTEALPRLGTAIENVAR